jgi:hypothetical protein
VAVLGGVDAIGFACKDVAPLLGFVREICHRLEFTGVKAVAAYEEQECWRLTGSETRIQVFVLIYLRPLAMAKHIPV